MTGRQTQVAGDGWRSERALERSGGGFDLPASSRGAASLLCGMLKALDSL